MMNRLAPVLDRPQRLRAGRWPVIALFWITIAALPSLAPAQSLGRLFLTPAERAALDSGARTTAGVPSPGAPATQSTGGLSAVRVDGLMKRSAGRNVVWVNGSPKDVAPGIPGGTPPAPRIEGDRVVVDAERSAPLRLRPGESDPPPGETQ